MNQNKYLKLIHPKIHQKCVLVVGAGGIGCQLIKNMFKWHNCLNITIMDYDTISQTNLNRQFCYRKSDTDKPKGSILQNYFNQFLTPNTNSKPYIQVINGKVQDYCEQYYSRFDLLVSALDNNEARKYLNEMAFKNGVGMVDAGTAGYNGQVQSYLRGYTQCRYCKGEQEMQNMYAVCTIRNRPQRNIHCVHFGLNFLSNFLQSDRVDKKQQENYGVETKLQLRHYLKQQQVVDSGQMRQICIQIHDYLFSEGLNDETKGIRKVKYNKKSSIQNSKLQLLLNQSIQGIEDYEQMNQIWSLQEYTQIFIKCLTQYIRNNNNNTTYQKDNPSHILLLTSIINLRVYNYKQVQQGNSKLSYMTYYECKDACGKIQPAIASTNAIAASLQIVHIMHILHGDGYDGIRYLSIHNYAQSKIQPIICRKPSIDCSLCSLCNVYVQVKCNMGIHTLKDVEQFLTNYLSLKQQDLRAKDVRSREFIIVRSKHKNNPNSNYHKCLKELNHNFIQVKDKQVIRLRYLKNKISILNLQILLIHYENLQHMEVVKNKNNLNLKCSIPENIQQYQMLVSQKQEKEKQWKLMESQFSQNSQIMDINIIDEDQMP